MIWCGGLEEAGERRGRVAHLDPFDEVARQVLSTVEKHGGRIEFIEIEKWAEFTEIGKYTLRTVVFDLIEAGKLRAPEGYSGNGDELEPPTPKALEIPKIPERDIQAMKRYLSEYWSVGELRLFEDMARFGIKEAGEVLKSVLSSGYAELTPSSVINATAKLLDEEGRGRRLQ
jgi:hypothetical protein